MPVSAALPVVETHPSAPLDARARVESIDVLRGMIMVLMAIDHVRVYSGVPPGGPEAGVFFTRWVTHFCAPGFAFFAGTSAFLYASKGGNARRFLLSRGFLLIALEITIIRFFWTFNLNLSEFILAGVIWMLGWCMVLLAPMTRLRTKVVAAIGVSIVLMQQLFAFVPHLFAGSARDAFGKFWEFIYPSGLSSADGISVLYSIVPWIGVMAAGYAFGAILLLPAARRRKLCLRIGIASIGLFLVLATLQAVMTATPDSPPFIFRLLNQAKYPASQLFLMMTLGPMILLVPFLENFKGRFAEVLKVFGRVPFFYYLLHILLIHVSALAVQAIRDGSLHHEWFAYAPYAQVPAEFRWSLGLLYLVFAVDVILLYFACRWYSKYKLSHPERKWLRYL